MKTKLKSLCPSNAASCSPSSDTPRMDKAAYEATTRTVGKWIVPLAKAQHVERLYDTECKDHAFMRKTLNRVIAERDALRIAGVEIIEAARRSLPRPHPTIERNAKLFIPENH